MVGTAEVAAILAARGYRVTGVDLSPDMLAVARERRAAMASEAGSRLTLIEGDITSTELPAHAFDLAYVGNGSWHLLLESAARAAALGRARDALRPGGKLAMELFPAAEADSIGPARTFSPIRPVAAGLSVQKTSQVTRDASRQLMVITEDLEVNGESIPNQLTLKLFRPAEVEAELTTAGFRGVTVLSLPGLLPYQPGQGQMLVVAEA